MKCPRYEVCKNEGQRLHPCPFKEELNGDSKTKCNCCKDCTQECREDV